MEVVSNVSLEDIFGCDSDADPEYLPISPIPNFIGGTSDSENELSGYTWAFEIYQGKVNRDGAGVGVAQTLVMKLMDSLLDGGRTL
ncbi:hypothetical protein J6590_084010 [Homalodisca vitripennis]|nr:hypothetical protein J6590_084010 [Homalodisca vitripennis]